MQEDEQQNDSPAVLIYRMREMERALTRIESKLDKITYVDRNDYKEDRKTDAETYATKEEIKPIKNLFWGVISTATIGIITAFIAFVVRGGLK